MLSSIRSAQLSLTDELLRNAVPKMRRPGACLKRLGFAQMEQTARDLGEKGSYSLRGLDLTMGYPVPLHLALNVGSLCCRNLSGVGGTPDSSRTSRKRRS
jgi:hypothetical protein